LTKKLILNVRWNTTLGATGAADAGAGVGAGAGAGPGRGAGGAGGPSPLIADQPPTKLYFCQTPEIPEPLNKYMFYDTDITLEGKTRNSPGVSTVRYGICTNVVYSTVQKKFKFCARGALHFYRCSHTSMVQSATPNFDVLANTLASPRFK